MTNRGKYKSKNYDEVLSYLKAMPGQHFTVNDLHAHFSEQGSSIGTTTIYRQLERMVDEGLVKKYTLDQNKSACFEYLNNAEHEGTHSSYHCICECCGNLIHLHCEEIEELQAHLFSEHHFRINSGRTVFYGLCEDCLMAEKETK
jgi:Fur family transcriptional regulator, ferric uptake regulator